MNQDEEVWRERYSRQIDLFGELGQQEIEQAHVAVLGLGGLGSHVCQQLAYLGVRNFILVDHDVVKRVNLNRLIGASESNLGEYKTAVAARLVQAVQPNGSIKTFEVAFPKDSVLEALTLATLIMGCFDNDYPRLLTLDVASRMQIPFIDAATDVIQDEDSLVYGGRVVVNGTSRGCLYCLGKLNQNEIRLAQMSQDQLEVEAKIYGVPVEGLVGTGPSVVTLNGAVASIATTEAMVILTGLRPAEKIQNYYASWGKVTRSKDTSKASCYYCDNWARPITQS